MVYVRVHPTLGGMHSVILDAYNMHPDVQMLGHLVVIITTPRCNTSLLSVALSPGLSDLHLYYFHQTAAFLVSHLMACRRPAGKGEGHAGHSGLLRDGGVQVRPGAMRASPVTWCHTFVSVSCQCLRLLRATSPNVWTGWITSHQSLSLFLYWQQQSQCSERCHVSSLALLPLCLGFCLYKIYGGFVSALSSFALIRPISMVVTAILNCQPLAQIAFLACRAHSTGTSQRLYGASEEWHIEWQTAVA